MREFSKAAQRICIPVFGLKHNHGLLFRYEAALARDAKLRGKIASDARDDAKRGQLVHKLPFLQPGIINTCFSL